MSADTLGLVADLLGIAGAFTATWAGINARAIRKGIAEEAARLNERLKIELRDDQGTQRITLGAPIRRADLSRAEVLGRLGMIPMSTQSDQKRFKLAHVGRPEFITQIDALSQSRGVAALIIPCSVEEIEQFDAEQIQHIALR